MIWLWRIPNNWPNKRIGTIIEGSGTDRFEFGKCNRLKGKNVICPQIIFECEEKYLYDVLPNDGRLIIVSQKVLDILDDFCNGDFEKFDANIYVKNKKINGYYLINILNKLDILDKEKSSFDTIGDSDVILGIENLVYKYDNLGENNIVRNKNYLLHVLVSDKLKKIFDNLKIKGVEFREK